MGFEDRDDIGLSTKPRPPNTNKKSENIWQNRAKLAKCAFICDERAARQWIWNYLISLRPTMKFILIFSKRFNLWRWNSRSKNHSWRKLCTHQWALETPDQLTQAELEKKRQERLLRQFEEYLSTAKANQKLKEVGLEAVIAVLLNVIALGDIRIFYWLGRSLIKEYWK